MRKSQAKKEVRSSDLKGAKGGIRAPLKPSDPKTPPVVSR